MSNWTYVALSFGLTWVVLFGYALSVSRRLRAARLQLSALDQPAAGAGAGESAADTIHLRILEAVR